MESGLMSRRREWLLDQDSILLKSHGRGHNARCRLAYAMSVTCLIGDISLDPARSYLQGDLSSLKLSSSDYIQHDQRRLFLCGLWCTARTFSKRSSTRVIMPASTTHPRESITHWSGLPCKLYMSTCWTDDQDRLHNQNALSLGLGHISASCIR